MKKLVFVFAVLAAMSISACSSMAKEEATTSNDSIEVVVDTMCCDTMVNVIDSVSVQ